MVIENQKENKLQGEYTTRSLTKEDIIEILNSDAIVSLKRPLVGALNRLGIGMPLWIQFTRGLGFTLLLAAGLVGYYVQWHAEIKQRQAEITARAASQLQKTIDRKIEWLVKIDTALIGLKSNIEDIQLACKDNVSIPIHEQNQLRLKERQKIVYAAMGAQYIFNEDLLNNIREYVDFDESIEDVCAKNAPTEIEWRKKLIHNNELMGDSIRKDQDTLLKFNSLKHNQFAT
jgi:hypothetical protein